MTKNISYVLSALAGGAIVLAAVLVGTSVLRPTALGERGIDRATIEHILSEPSLVASGKTDRFDLKVTEADWELLPGVTTRAVTFNGSVPGPLLRVTEGDSVEIAVTNTLKQPTSVHWHGVHVPNAQDGVAGITQDAIGPGATFTYRFTAPHAGTFMYHAHGPASREQIDRGLYGALIIDPRGNDPLRVDREYVLALQGWMAGADMGPMDAMSMEYDYFTVNGKSYPATSPITAKTGELVRLRFVNPGQTIHPMHLHGTDMAIVAKDGETLSVPQRVNTITLEPGDTYDAIFKADNPGRWLLHCHDLHHSSNNGVEPGGLVVEVIVGEAAGTPAAPTVPPAAPRSAMPTMMPSNMPGMLHKAAP